MLQRARLSVVLVCPEIPGNTGNIARSCAAAQVPLHLVKPLGFSIEDKALKRAGLDYWGKMQICEHNRLEDFLESTMGRDKGSRRLIGFSKHGTMAHTDLQYRHGDLLMFGSETRGLPPAAHHACDKVVRIPIHTELVRSLNLAVAAGIGTFEALRQLDAVER
eukprot:TRINITY_DN19590_c0_g1_i1.p1 TRINITY_DN19590_c0_g1~~TRINITY_DN19590_c0_g1_i1.p1  ORF type:complete len:163 (+),score=22.44 TRINITY_DN19590_c0_g1_i1:28-516(+)